MVKVIIKTEKEFKENILTSFEKIGDYTYGDVIYHRYAEYIIDLIERHENDKIPILYTTSKKLLDKQVAGFENIYIFNEGNSSTAILRLSLMEVKSFQPKNNISFYREFNNYNNVIINENNNESKLKKAYEDVVKHKNSSNREEQIERILNKLLCLPNEINKNLNEYKEINTVFFEDIKSKLSNRGVNEIGSLDMLYNDLQKLWDKQHLNNVSIGTIVSNNLSIEDKWISTLNDERIKSQGVENLTCIIQHLDEPDYKGFLDYIVKYNSEKNNE